MLSGARSIRKALTLSFNILGKKLNRITSKPSDRESDELTTIRVACSGFRSPKLARLQMLNAL